MIYFDNASTTLVKPSCVAEAVFESMNKMANASRGAYEYSLNSERIIFSAREKIANMFSLKSPSCVAFTSNSTEALNTAIKGILEKGDHVITTALEHNSVLRPLYETEKLGVEITVIKADLNGNINYDDIKNSIKHNTKCLVCTHASNVTGNMTDIETIGNICKNNKIIFILDASQTAGVFNIDVYKHNIDVLCFTGHKSLMAPQGTGGICVKEDIKIKPLKTGGSGIKSYLKEHPSYMPVALEAGTLNGHGIAGLNASLKYIEEIGINTIKEKEISLMKIFYNNVQEIEEVTIYGDYSVFERAPIVSLNIDGFNSSFVSDKLSSVYNIATRPGAHCAPLMHEALKTVDRGMVRFSFSYFNTESEIEESLKSIKDFIYKNKTNRN